LIKEGRKEEEGMKKERKIQSFSLWENRECNRRVIGRKSIFLQQI